MRTKPLCCRDPLAVDLDHASRGVPASIAIRVVQDGEQPGLEVRPPLELFGEPKRLCARVLHQILGICPASRQAQGRPVQGMSASVSKAERASAGLNRVVCRPDIVWPAPISTARPGAWVDSVEYRPVRAPSAPRPGESCPLDAPVPGVHGSGRRTGLSGPDLVKVRGAAAVRDPGRVVYVLLLHTSLQQA